MSKMFTKEFEILLETYLPEQFNKLTSHAHIEIKTAFLSGGKKKPSPF